MKITLYKNCILTNSYREVFDCKIRDFGKDETGETKYNSFFNLYLNSLENFVYIDNDSIYTNFKGSLYFDLTINNENLYNYNYMKIENNDFVRYCFIDDIEIRNDIAVVRYSEDIWHTYSKDIKMKKSLLYATLHDLKESTIVAKYLPKDYLENDLTMNSLFEYTPQNYGTLLMKVQLYKLDEQGTQTARLNFNTMVLTKQSEAAYIHFDYTYIETVINNIILNSAVKQVNYDDNDWYYEISDIIIIPNKLLVNVSHTVQILFNLEDYYFVDFVNYLYKNNDLFTYKEVFSYTYNQDDIRKIVSIGSFVNRIQIDQNGKPIDIKVRISADYNNTSIIFCIQGKIIDVTNDFFYEAPVKSVTSSEFQLAKLNKSIKTLNAVGSGVNAVGSLVGGLAVGSVGMTLAGVQAGFQTATNIMDIKSKYYDSTKMVQTKDIAPITYIYGIIIYKIVPLNEDEVLQALNEQGYLVENDVTLSIDPVEIETVTEDTNIINPIRFNRISIYGEFTQNITKQIEEILMNGTKIIYNRSGNGII